MSDNPKKIYTVVMKFDFNDIPNSARQKLPVRTVLVTYNYEDAKEIFYATKDSLLYSSETVEKHVVRTEILKTE